MRWVIGLCAAMTVAAGVALADGERFVQAAWLCLTPEAHEEAVAAVQHGEALDTLRARLLAERKCTYLPEEDFIKVLTSVTIAETRGDLVRVRFSLQEGHNRPREVRHEVHYRMVVWTARANLSAGEEAPQQ